MGVKGRLRGDWPPSLLIWCAGAIFFGPLMQYPRIIQRRYRHAMRSWASRTCKRPHLSPRPRVLRRTAGSSAPVTALLHCEVRETNLVLWPSSSSTYIFRPGWGPECTASAAAALRTVSLPPQCVSVHPGSDGAESILFPTAQCDHSGLQHNTFGFPGEPGRIEKGPACEIHSGQERWRNIESLLIITTDGTQTSKSIRARAFASGRIRHLRRRDPPGY